MLKAGSRSLVLVFAALLLVAGSHLGAQELGFVAPIDDLASPIPIFKGCPETVRLGTCSTSIPGYAGGHCRQRAANECLLHNSSGHDRLSCLQSVLGISHPALNAQALTLCAPPLRFNLGCGCKTLPNVGQVFGGPFPDRATCQKDLDDTVSLNAEVHNTFCTVLFGCANPRCPNPRNFYPVNECACARDPNPRDPGKPWAWGCTFTKPATCCCLRET